MNCHYFLVAAAVVLWDGVSCTSKTATSADGKKALDEIRSLYHKTAPDSMRCWFKFTTDAKAKCKKETEEFKHQLVLKVQDATKKHYITPVEGKCVAGYAQYNIGVFEDPALLPCDEHAFNKPKHTDAEIDATYKNLLALYNAYDKICVKGCEAKKQEAGLKLAEAIEKAEKADIIPPKCHANGIGWYSFYQGMQPAEMPCKPGAAKTPIKGPAEKPKPKG